LLHVSRLVANETSQLFPTNPDGTRSVDRSWDQGKTWKQMEQVYRSGKVKAIGVSNFSIPYLENLEKTWEVVPVVNQVRSSILNFLYNPFLILSFRLSCIHTTRNMR
jgi:diketogulonate reductase-like aldo/keto reductase